MELPRKIRRIKENENQDTPLSLKVLEFKCCKIKALKVLENEGGPRKLLKTSGKFYCIIARITSAAVTFKKN